MKIHQNTLGKFKEVDNIYTEIFKDIIHLDSIWLNNGTMLQPASLATVCFQFHQLRLQPLPCSCQFAIQLCFFW